MVERQRRGRTRWPLGVLLIMLLAGGCGAPDEEDENARERVGELLDRQAEAVRDGDLEVYLSAVDPGASRYRAQQRATFRNLDRLPLKHWSYHVTGLQLREDGVAYAQVRLRYQLRGFDAEPVTATEELVFENRDDDWYRTAERPGSPRQLWEQGRMSVHRGDHSLVLSADGGDEANAPSARMLRRVVTAADRAVPAVTERWPRDWARRLVVEVPGTLDGVGRRIGTPAESYQGIAALTLGKGGGGRPANRIVVNPGAYGELSDTGRQVVMTHESTHVATRDATSDATPMWLSEGLGDWFGYLDSGRSPRAAAPKLGSAVRGGTVPQQLPSDDRFAYDAGAETLGMAYEGSWLACRMIAEDWDEARLMEFYQRVGRHGGEQQKAVDTALRDVLGLGRAEFTARWRDYLRAELG